MTNFFENIPDFLVGPLVAAGIWFGFNYAVLAERAMERIVVNEMIPNCINELMHSERSVFIPKMPNMPHGFPDFLNPNKMLDRYAKALRIGPARRKAICICGAKRTASSLKFDYAIHTASFPPYQTGLGQFHAGQRSFTCKITSLWHPAMAQYRELIMTNSKKNFQKASLLTTALIRSVQRCFQRRAVSTR